VKPWTCPACRTPIRYDDYDRVLRFLACPVCQLAVTIDKKTDGLIDAQSSTSNRQ
jgi:uncharacterized protein YbaR (Trm112 family)